MRFSVPGWLASFAAGIFCSTACLGQPNVQFSAAQFGYAETTDGRSLLSEAISKSNTVLSGSPFHLVPSWLPFTNDGTAVPVYLIRNDPADMVFVPRNCFCIVVVPQTLSNWLATNSADPNDLAIADNAILAFILLHEVGHLAHHDNAGVSFSPLPTDAKNLNIELNTAKDVEFAADAWAADKVREAFQPGKAGFLSAMDIQFALTHASWNLARRRLIDDFGATVLRDPRVIFDEGYSHPNFELRMLVVNELLSDTEASKALRREFESLRQTKRE